MSYIHWYSVLDEAKYPRMHSCDNLVDNSQRVVQHVCQILPENLQ